MKPIKFVDFCRYYKGEKECPKNTNEMFWDYERVWCNENEKPTSEILMPSLDGYIRSGLYDFSQNDHVPVTLKSLLYERYVHWAGGNGIDEDVKGFKSFYNDYLNG